MLALSVFSAVVTFRFKMTMATRSVSVLQPD